LTSFADTYFVATNGLDSNPGSEFLPWRTVQKAGDTLTSGDTAYIREGTYQERVEPANSGTSNSPIVYAAYPGETAVLDGAGVAMSVDDGLFEVYALQYLEIRDLTVINSSGSGIMLAYSTNILVCGNTTSNTVQSGVAA